MDFPNLDRIVRDQTGYMLVAASRYQPYGWHAVLAEHPATGALACWWYDCYASALVSGVYEQSHGREAVLAEFEKRARGNMWRGAFRTTVGGKRLEKNSLR